MPIELTQEELVNQVKMKAGISIDAKDSYIDIIVRGVIQEIKDIHKIQDLDISQVDDFLLVLDYSEWRYSSRGEGGYFEFRAPNGEGANILPQHLGWRLKNRYLMKGRIQRTEEVPNE